jgi:hypothetical protein
MVSPKWKVSTTRRRAFTERFHIGQHPDHYFQNGQLAARGFGIALVAVAHSELDYFVKYSHFCLFIFVGSFIYVNSIII